MKLQMRIWVSSSEEGLVAYSVHIRPYHKCLRTATRFHKEDCVTP